MKKVLLAVWTVITVLFVGPVLSETVSVGRVDVVLTPGDWRLISTADGQNLINGSPSNLSPIETKVFGLIDSGRLMAVIRLSASKGSSGRSNWVGKCESTGLVYAQEIGNNSNATECVRASSPLKAKQYLVQQMPEAAKAVEDNKWTIPSGMYLLSATVADTNGTFTEARLFVVPSFAGSPSELDGNLPNRVRSDHLAWTKQLALQVKSSVYSTSGRMLLPLLVITPTSPQ